MSDPNIDRALRILEMAEANIQDAKACLQALTPAVTTSSQPSSTGYFMPSTYADRYLQAIAWGKLQRIGDAAGVTLTILRACPLKMTIDQDTTDAHIAMDQPDGGMMVDVAYPIVAPGMLDVPAMKRIREAWFKECRPFYGVLQETNPKQWAQDLANQCEIRVGGDVAVVIGNDGDNHFVVDDTLHHRFDDPVYPHFHGRLA